MLSEQVLSEHAAPSSPLDMPPSRPSASVPPAPLGLAKAAEAAVMSVPACAPETTPAGRCSLVSPHCKLNRILSAGAARGVGTHGDAGQTCYSRVRVRFRV